MDAAVGFAKANGERFVEELKELLRISSVAESVDAICVSPPNSEVDA